MKFLFLPISLLSGLFAGQMSKKLFDFIWARIDDEDAPRPKHRKIELPKLALALVIEGALFRLIKGLVDHSSRRGFWKATGSWPGEEEPEPV
ncbi:MAG TPA: DUF4235 domain-containing protein [Myxococcales bacterium]|jgi:hypothetical protein|nr:DUF4235 domain-containing protein [Myxococcales bacterium]